MKTDAKYPDIFLGENDKLNYLSTLLSSTELIDKHSDKLRMVVIQKLRYQYKRTTLKKDDLIQMGVAKHLLLKITGCNGKLNRTHSYKKLKTSPAKTTVETAGATTKMVNFTAKFIMQNVDPKDHLFFTLYCNGYNI